MRYATTEVHQLKGKRAPDPDPPTAQDGGIWHLKGFALFESSVSRSTHDGTVIGTSETVRYVWAWEWEEG